MTRSEEKKDEVPKSPADYVIEHQRSFRTAFDFLASHFPPGSTPEWWEQTANDASAASIGMGENELTVKLLVGVYDYLENEFKRREGIS